MWWLWMLLGLGLGAVIAFIIFAIFFTPRWNP